ncbi:MAG: photosystem reaction center subunit [Pedosphaera sp.]|nr:photosystem reaction center subunit [Pedosphaera sp.]
MAATLALGTGCSTFHRQAKNNQSPPAPIVAGNAYGEPAAMGGMGPGYETQSGSACTTSAAASQSANNVVIPLEKEKLHVGKEQVSNGAVRIRKTVKTETVTKPVEIRQETVTVDRVPATAGQGNAQGTALNQPFQNGEITINLTKEQPMVQTETVPAGCVVIHKQETTQPVNVQGQVRSEDVVAEPLGNPQNVNISGNLRNPQGEQASAPANEAAGAPAPMAGQSSGAGNNQPISQMDQLNYSASNPSALVGRQVGLANANVEKVISPQLLTIRAADGTIIYVRATQPFRDISAGQAVNLNGTVRQTPADTSHLGWDPTSAQAVQGQQIFIEVQSIAPPGQ